MHLRPIALALAFAASFSSALIAAEPAAPAVKPDEALARLLEGNHRFVAGALAHPHQTNARRTELATGQAPVAIVLTCSDSRVSPELYFDQGLGDLFVIRNAGNVIDDHVLGSIEYAVEHLHVSLIVVVGHERCGAVAAAAGGGHAAGHIVSIVESIAPSVEATKSQSGDKVDNVVRTNASHSAELLAKSEPLLSAARKEGKLKIVAARYDLDTGSVELLP